MSRYAQMINMDDFRNIAKTESLKMLKFYGISYERPWYADNHEDFDEVEDVASALFDDTQIYKDLSKIEFDFENHSCSKSEVYIDDSDELMGFNVLDNGMTYLGCSAGGDWEHPLFFIIYWDGKKLRGYVPTDGNTWNTITKTAYGSEEDSTVYKTLSESQIEKFENISCNPTLKLDKASIVADIQNRIHIKE